MVHREPLLSRSVRICAGTAVLALAFSGVAAAQDDPYGIGTPVAASGTGVTAAPGLEAIELASGRITLRLAEKQNGRAWTQPLYEKRPRQPKQSKPQKPEPPSDPTPSGDTPAQ